MERHWALFAAAVLLALLGRVEVDTAFVSPASSSSAAAPARSALRGAAPQAAQGSSAGSFQIASALLVIGACASASRARAQQRARAPRAQMLAVAERCLTPPTMAYTQALLDGAAKLGESVAVTKDVMKVIKLMSDDDFKQKLMYFTNLLGGRSAKHEADGYVELFQPLESKAFPKFIQFLAKKRRMLQMMDICNYYMKYIYTSQGIKPVTCRTAQKLTDAQKDALKAKLKAKLGCEDIKLVEIVQPSLIAGFQLEWNFTEPEDLRCPTEGLDFSIKHMIYNKAIEKGVVPPSPVCAAGDSKARDLGAE